MVIYLIRNLVNGKVYVGQTVVKHPNQRKRQHFSRLKCGTHNNPHLQAAYNKYGAKVFQFEVCEVVNSLELLNTLEKTWIEFYKNQGKSYNLRNGGDRNLISCVTKQRMKIAQNKPELLQIRSNVHKGVPKSKEHIEKIRQSNVRTKARPVIKYSITGNILNEFNSVYDAFIDWGKSRSGLESHLYRGAKSKEIYYRFK